MLRKLTLIMIAAAGLSLAACQPAAKTADQEQAAKTEQMVAAGVQSVGMPDIHNFSEMHDAKDLYEERDKMNPTYTYIFDMMGKTHLVCKSYGYGLPYSVQFSNPEKMIRLRQASYYKLPQPEPNGLFMPEGLSATWVKCAGDKGSYKWVYIEPTIVVSPFKLDQME